MKRSLVIQSCIAGVALLASTAALAASRTELISGLPGHTLLFIGLSVFATIYFGHIRFDTFAVAHGQRRQSWSKRHYFLRNGQLPSALPRMCLRRDEDG